MPGLQVADVGERHQLIEPLRRAPCGRLKQKPDMIADVGLVQDAAGEPPDRVGEDGQSVRPGLPRATIELVEPVAGLTAEQPGKSAMPARENVYREVCCRPGDTVGVVALRQSDQKPGRIDADLAGEPDQTSAELVARPRRSSPTTQRRCGVHGSFSNLSTGRR